MFRKIDKPTVILYLLFIILGWVCIFEASFDNAQSLDFNITHRSVMQLVWIAVCLTAAFVILNLKPHIILSLAFVIYGVVVLLLIATVFLAPNIKGSHSWLVIGPFSVQPAEFAKFATALALAKLIDSPNYKFLSLSKKICFIGLIIVFPILVIVAQDETGTALVFLAFALALYRIGLSQYVILVGVLLASFFVIIILTLHNTSIGTEGTMGQLININIINIIAIIIYNNLKDRYNMLKTKYIVFGYIALALFAVLINRYLININFVFVSIAVSVLQLSLFIYFFFKTMKNKYLWLILFVAGFIGYTFAVEFVFEQVMPQHQRTRIEVYLGMKDDPQNTEWNVNQSQIAIGSGGLLGKGFLKGTQTKLKFVPEQDTDFIFCTIGEELGFWGSGIVLILFFIFIFRLVKIAERQTYMSSKIYGYCVVSVFLFHVLINIGMVIGVMPVIGIPLPFFSYGGSSLLAFTIMLFILLLFDSARYVNRN